MKYNINVDRAQLKTEDPSADKLYRDHGNDYRPVIDCFTHAEWIIIRRWSIPHCHIYIPTAKAVQLIGAIKIQSRMARQNE